MADVFIDCEWIEGDYLTILGAYSHGQDRFQLYDETLTRKRFSKFRTQDIDGGAASCGRI
ncbi:MAG: hypothetical protein DDT29_01938 [Dehalococcoidia bacterium]|nr:hypothetical protein [Bacillota bacterium]